MYNSLDSEYYIYSEVAQSLAQFYYIKCVFSDKCTKV